MTDMFPDRREMLFGREAEIQWLTNRASQPGLTALVARPLMGKTWTLNEMARRLLEEDDYLIGYHESKAAESSHLLYAVSNLYSRWLSDATQREQAISLWERHKDNLVPRIGQMVGGLFNELGKSLLPAAVAALVRSAFDGLAESQSDLLSGGNPIAPLPYDQALSLTNLVANVSSRRVVLILDAWEKSLSIRSEFATLELYLKHLDDWPRVHLFLAVRNPELDSTKLDNEAYRRAEDLCKINPAAEVCQLGHIDQEDAKENQRIVSFVQSRIPVANNVSSQSLLEMIAGYPGVLDFWTNETVQATMQTEEDLRLQASNAQALRYLELDLLLSRLQEPQLTIAARLAFFPRLDAEKWLHSREVLLKDQNEAVVDALIDSTVFIDERFPTYGHDTRHAAAQSWFIQNKRPLMRRISEQIIRSLAISITGINRVSLPFFESLAACSETARLVGTDPILCCLSDSAQSAIGNDRAIIYPTYDNLYHKAVQLNSLFVPLLAVSLNRRGVMKGMCGDNDGALADYSTVLALPGVPTESVAMTTFNRGVTKGLCGDTEGALADYTTVIELPDAPAESVARALNERGRTRDKCDDSHGMLADYTAVIELPDAPTEIVSSALHSRGQTKDKCGDIDGAIADHTTVIELHDAPTKFVASALCSRGSIKEKHGDTEGALADYSAVLALPDAPTEIVALAFLGHVRIKNESGDSDGVLAACTAIIELPNAPSEFVLIALSYRGRIKGKHGDTEAALADYSAVLALPDAPTDYVTRALYRRGIIKRKSGDSEGAAADFTAVIELADAPTEYVARALYDRGLRKWKSGDTKGALADYTTVIQLPDPPKEVVGAAFIGRGIMKDKCGDTEAALADYTTVIELPEAPAESVARALYRRGIIKRKSGDSEGALADYTAVIELPDAPVDLIKLARSALELLC